MFHLEEMLKFKSAHFFFRALRGSRAQGWIASGFFDHTIKLWNLPRASQVSIASFMAIIPPGLYGARELIRVGT